MASFGQYRATINVDGEGGGDNFVIDATADTNYVVNIVDTGPLTNGVNNLTINGATTVNGQTYLFRDDFVAILGSADAPVYERINYDDTITGRLTVNGGNVAGTAATDGDYYAMDGNSAVTTVNAGNGADWFQVGQMYNNAAIGNAAGDVGALLGDSLHVTATTVGLLSDGVDKATVLYGGSGSDTFEVYSNKADLSMIGGSGNDLFVVRAFQVAQGTQIGIKGGSGDDKIEYNVNAPVDIEGGTGFNTLVLMGTEGNDTFVVTPTGVFGDGLNVTYSKIQALTIDTLEGDDTVYVLGTTAGVVTTINGGVGEKTYVVGGDVTGTVVSQSANGLSTSAESTVASGDIGYNGIFVQGLSVSVATAASQIINQPTQSTLVVNDPNSTVNYIVNAPTGLLAGQKAYVEILPAAPSAEWRSQGAAAVQVSTDGGLTWSNTGVVGFVGGGAASTSVLLRAAPIAAGDTYARDETIVVANRVVSVDVPGLNSLTLPSVKLTLQASASGLIISQPDAATTIAAGQTSYSYQLTLNKQPAPGETVTVNLSGPNGASLPAGVQLSQSVFTFNASNWDQPQTVTVSSSLTGSHGSVAVDIEQSIVSSDTNPGETPAFATTSDVGDVKLTVAPTNTPGVLLLTPQSAAVVSAAGETYTYQMVLTQAPTADVVVSLVGDGETIASSSAAGFNAQNQTITFTAQDWNVPVTITLSANPNYTPSQSGQGSTSQSTVTFPPQPHTLAQINGPLIFDGASEPGQPTLVSAVALPYEINNPPVAEPAADTTPNAAPTVDNLRIFDDGESAGETGLVSTIGAGDLFAGEGDNLSGLDMPSSGASISQTTNGVTTTYENGISWSNLDTVEIYLGRGDDKLTVDTTAATVNSKDGLQTMLVVEGGGGANTIDVTASSDPLVLYGAESGSGVEYNSAPGALTGNAFAFSNFGNDVIDASGATGTVVMVGGPSQNTLTGGAGINWISGGSGQSTISAAGAQNYVIADSTFTVGELEPSPVGNSDRLDLASRLLTIDNDPTVMDGGLLAAGNDTITVTGAGSSVVIGGYGIIDIAGQTAGVVDPFASLGIEQITEIASANTSLGGDNVITVGNNDVVIGGAGSDKIIVGAVGADVIIGDSGEIDYANGVLVAARSVDPLHGGDDTISGPLVNGLPTPGGSGGSVVIGGVGADTIDLGGAGNTIIGNDGSATFTATGQISTIISSDPAFGGNNVISVAGGKNVIIGGSGADQITVGGGGNVVLGDNGEAFFSNGVLANNQALGFAIGTTDQTFGGADTIVIDGDGANVVFGGSGADTITVNGNGDNVVFGDNGAAAYVSGVLIEAETTGETAPAETVGGTTFPSSESGNSGVVYGGDDTIAIKGAGNNVVVGGLGADTITTGAGNAIVLGDSGVATFDPTTGALTEITSDVVTFAAGAPQLDLAIGSANLGVSSNDTITLGDGNNVVIGGAGSDQIIVGATGANVVIGDDGEAVYTKGILTSIFSTDTTLGVGGNDSITGPVVNGAPTYGGSGGNVVIGGSGANTIMMGGANNTIIGADGEAAFGQSGEILTAQTISPADAGANTILVSGGGNVILGGSGANDIEVQTVGGSAPSGNVILGHDGMAVFVSEPTGAGTATSVLTSIETTDQAYGESVKITAGDGDNVIFGGSGEDQITVGDGANVVMGKDGEATFTATLVSGSVAANDAVYSRILTSIETTAEEDENGQLTELAPTLAAGDFGADTTAGTVYGGDATITVGAGNNVIIGGLGANTITVGAGDNIVVGESGAAVFDATTGVIEAIESTYPTATGGGSAATGTSQNNVITLGDGNNIVIGGSGSNQITLGALGSDVVIGANGQALFTNGVLTSIASTDPTNAGSNTIEGPNGAPGGSGHSTVIGGSAANVINIGGSQNTIIGADGRAAFSDTGVIVSAASLYVTTAGANLINVTGGGNVVIGGSGSNTITLGAAPGDAVIGANGEALFTNGVLTTLESTTPAYAGNNVITGLSGAPGGSGQAAIIGGSGSNFINIGGSENTIIGAAGDMSFSTAGLLEAAISVSPAKAGNNTITAGGGDNTIIGGSGSNKITVGALGPDAVVGSSGTALFTNGVLTLLESIAPGYAGNDTITVLAARRAGPAAARSSAAGDQTRSPSAETATSSWAPAVS